MAENLKINKVDNFPEKFSRTFLLFKCLNFSELEIAEVSVWNILMKLWDIYQKCQKCVQERNGRIWANIIKTNKINKKIRIKDNTISISTFWAGYLFSKLFSFWPISVLLLIFFIFIEKYLQALDRSLCQTM